MTSSFFEDTQGIDLRFADDEAPERAPNMILVAAFGMLAVSAAMFIPAIRTLSIVGYVIAALLVPLVVIAFRIVKRGRQRSTRYVEDPRWNFVPVVVLVLSITIAIAHAFFYAKVEELVQ